MSEKKDFCFAVYQAFKSKNQKTLRKLNKKILNKAVLSSTKDYFDLAVYSYVLSKILSKNHFLSKEYSNWFEAIEIDLIGLTESADSSIKIWNSAISSLRKTISSLEEEDSRYIMSNIKKGELKSAATLYAQGLSLGLSSQVTGIEKQEILEYAGKTMMFDRMEEEMDIFERLKHARKLVGD
ncbi:MAG: hypothetical protein PHU63_01410 [Candidatus ainarchaeum sp.]|nr:hypothetical protein [Candidatus ainarchaeum sp.]